MADIKNQCPKVNKLLNQHQQQGKKLSIGGKLYQIKVEGYLDKAWSEWLGGLLITHDEEGNSWISGVIRDQAALHGVMVKIRDLGLPILSLESVEINMHNNR